MTAGDDGRYRVMPQNDEERQAAEAADVDRVVVVT